MTLNYKSNRQRFAISMQVWTRPQIDKFKSGFIDLIKFEFEFNQLLVTIKVYESSWESQSWFSYQRKYRRLPDYTNFLTHRPCSVIYNQKLSSSINQSFIIHSFIQQKICSTFRSQSSCRSEADSTMSNFDFVFNFFNNYHKQTVRIDWPSHGRLVGMLLMMAHEQDGLRASTAILNSINFIQTVYNFFGDKNWVCLLINSFLFFFEM